jgi:Domain of unknown function (DUF3850)
MTHFFLVNENEMGLVSTGAKKFDILKFGRAVSIGDTIIYQLEEKTPSEQEDDAQKEQGLDVPEEYSVKIDYLFEDTEGSLKKGFVGVGFKIEI